MKEQIFNTIEALEPEMLATLSDLIAIPAINPMDGGTGEFYKGEYLVKKLKELGFDNIEVYNSEDKAAAGGVRPNIVAKIPGKTSKRLWIISHTDVVPEGERTHWHTDPFKAEIKDGRIYGRGSNDNCQELVSSLYAAVALKKLGITPEYETYLCMVADEEVGSTHGIAHLIKQKLFRDDDLIIVPDGGNDKGSFIEVAEKSICWIEFEMKGEQVHASMPQLGSNACRAANEFSVALDAALHAAFPEEDKLFEPAVSTFEPTRRNANVPNVNTVPGREVFCFDCRVLPTIPLEEVLKVVDAEIKKIKETRKVEVTYRFVQKEQAPAPTASDAEIVGILRKALTQVLPVEPTVGGVGGGTCAAFFRREGIPAVVWCQEADCAHMPNEYAEISHIINESKIFALMMSGK